MKIKAEVQIEDTKGGKSVAYILNGNKIYDCLVEIHNLTYSSGRKQPPDPRTFGYNIFGK